MNKNQKRERPQGRHGRDLTRDRVWIPARAQEGGGSECPGHVEV